MEILSAASDISSIIALLITIFLTSQIISIKTSINKTSKNKVAQKGNHADGDMAGRDVNKQ